ncbi:uncharacterized protein BDV14DRAFT_196987 [Aspergillus stella-maris]|uniref:uncharacterized protein n=1 Tax=Aspergillus stella-maris TaxID=1810926 RepID=UPI003CCD39C5
MGYASPSTLIRTLNAIVEERNAAVAAGASSPSRTNPKKRKADNNTNAKPIPIASDTSPEPESESDIDSDDPALSPKWTCGQIRDKEIKVSEFQNAVGVSWRGYYDFMKQAGAWKGEDSDTFASAHQFFMKREILGVERKMREQRKKEKRKVDNERRKKKDREALKALDSNVDGNALANTSTGTGTKDTNADAAPAPAKKPKSLAASNKQAKEAEFTRKYDTSTIYLEGEEDTTVEVYDHCDKIRKKIHAVLKGPLMTRTAFLREILKTFPDCRDEPSRALQGTTLTSFLSKKGTRDGATSLIFYAAYVFFEKLRVRDGKPKTAFREEMEDVWEVDEGFDRTTRPNQTFICHVSRVIYDDEYGHIRSGPRY